MDIDSIINNLTGLDLLDESELDITWNYFNLLSTSNEMLLFILTKTSLVPMIDFFSPISSNSQTKVYEEFGLSYEEGKNVQKYNIELLNIQRAIQIYCTQQYSLLSYSGKMFETLIDDIKEETDDNRVENFVKILDAFTNKNSTSQLGGSGDQVFYFIFKLLCLVLLVIPNVKSLENNDAINTNLEFVLTSENVYNPNNIAIISDKSEREFRSALEIMEYKQKSINVSKIIAAYDKNTKQQYDNLFGSFLIYMYETVPNGREKIISMIDEVNKDLRIFSTDVTKNCIELMEKSYDNDIFLNLKSIDEIETTERKIEIARKTIQDENDKSVKKMRADTAATTLAATASVLSGDLQTATIYAGEAGKNLWNLLSFNSDEDKETKNIIDTENETRLAVTTVQKTNFESNLYKFSKTYCSYGYNLQFSFENDILNVMGDKIDHDYIIRLIEILEKNLELEISTLKLDETKNIQMNLLISTHQRLNILKAITNKLSDIVNFSVYSHIMKLQIQPTPKTIDEIKKYFDDQLLELNQLLSQLNELFPINKDKIVDKQKILEAKIAEQNMEQTILDIKAKSENDIRNQDAERYSDSMNSTLLATTTYTKSWFNLFEGTVESVGESAGSLLGASSYAVFSSIFQIPTGLVDATMSFGNNTVYKMLINPSGWIAISGILFFIKLYFDIKLGLIRKFFYGGKTFLVFISKGLMFVYEVIKKPFGFILKKIKVLIIDKPMSSDEMLQQIPVRRSQRIMERNLILDEEMPIQEENPEPMQVEMPLRMRRRTPQNFMLQQPSFEVPTMFSSVPRVQQEVERERHDIANENQYQPYNLNENYSEEDDNASYDENSEDEELNRTMGSLRMGGGKKKRTIKHRKHRKHKRKLSIKNK